MHPRAFCFRLSTHYKCVVVVKGCSIGPAMLSLLREDYFINLPTEQKVSTTPPPFTHAPSQPSPLSSPRSPLPRSFIISTGRQQEYNAAFLATQEHDREKELQLALECVEDKRRLIQDAEELEQSKRREERRVWQAGRALHEVRRLQIEVTLNYRTTQDEHILSRWRWPIRYELTLLSASSTALLKTCWKISGRWRCFFYLDELRFRRAE